MRQGWYFGGGVHDDWHICGVGQGDDDGQIRRFTRVEPGESVEQAGDTFFPQSRGDRVGLGVYVDKDSPRDTQRLVEGVAVRLEGDETVCHPHRVWELAHALAIGPGHDGRRHDGDAGGGTRADMGRLDADQIGDALSGSSMQFRHVNELAACGSHGIDDFRVHYGATESRQGPPCVDDGLHSQSTVDIHWTPFHDPIRFTVTEAQPLDAAAIDGFFEPNRGPAEPLSLCLGGTRAFPNLKLPQKPAGRSGTGSRQSE